MQNENIDGLNIFETTFLCTAYADGTTFLIKDEKSVIGLMKTFDTFSTLSGLKPNKSKWEIAGSGALKAVKLALCGMECVDLMFNAIKILGVYYSYEKNLENQEKIINLVLKVEKLLTLWRMQNLSIAGKITAFKIVHLALVKVIPNLIIVELEKINKHFIWKNGNPRIKQDTLCKDYENGGLKNVNITFKIISLQYSWVKRLYGSSTIDWKLIPLHIITQKLGKHFLIHSNLYIDPKKIRQFPKYYQDIISKWNSNLSVPPKTSSTIASQIIWYNKHILVDKRPFYNTTLADKRINHVGQLFDTNCAMKPWSVFESKFSLGKSSHFYWIQSNNDTLKAREENLYKGDKNFNGLTSSGHHIKKYQIYALSKCYSKELYSLQISLNDSKTKSQIYFEKLFQNKEIEWKCICPMTRRVTTGTNLRIF